MAERITNDAGRAPKGGSAGRPLGNKKLTPRTALDTGIKGVLFLAAFFSIIALFFIIVFLFQSASGLLDEYSLWEVLFEDKWMPTYPPPIGGFGAWSLIVGTILVSLGAMAFAIPIGIGSAIFVSQLAPSWIRDFLKTGIEILAGVPSVVYGLFGLIVLVRWIKVGFDQPSGEGWLAASLILGVMALPTIISVSEDALSAITREQREASLALGATKWQTISQVIVPGSISGITAAIILGIGRAMGETMAVMMVGGNTAVIPDPITDVFSGIKTSTAAIGIEMGEASGLHQDGLFFLAVILFVMVTVINTTAIYIMGKIKAKNLGQAKKGRKLIDIKVPMQVRDIWSIAYKVLIFLGILWLMFMWFDLIVGVLITLGILGVYLFNKFVDPKKSQWVGYIMVSLTMLVTLASLGVILYYIVSEGMGALSIDFIIKGPRDQGRSGGIFPAIMGTIYLVLGAILIATPLGVGAGIYIAEYAREGKVLRIIRLGIDNLNGTPSIVFGLFAFAFMVIYLDWGVALITGIVILSIMVLPTIIRTTEEAMKSVPHAVREGSLALGATKWETIWKVVLPPAFPGIITGIILSIGRAAGESAPILFTAVAFITRDPVNDLFHPTMALPTHIFFLAAEIPGGMDNASGTALVLIIMILIVYSAAAILRKRFAKKNRW
jgi:phosphate transport system permease protein